jgi:hypothetical protein
MSLGTPVAAYPVDGPLDVIDEYTGCVNENLHKAIMVCLEMDRNLVKQRSSMWTWEQCWTIFRDNLVNII